MLVTPFGGEFYDSEGLWDCTHRFNRTTVLGLGQHRHPLDDKQIL
jgi:hypothetical protein